MTPGWVLARLHARPTLLGVLLYGSRATGQARQDSDIDLLVIVAGDSAPAAEGWSGPDGNQADVHFMTLADWQRLPQREHWTQFGLSRGTPLLDPHGVVASGLAALQQPPAPHREQGAAHLDSYLNSAYRSVKAWRAGNELGARLHATLSLTFLLDALFRFAGHWTPYWDRLDGQWDRLAGLGLDVEVLREQVMLVAHTPTDRAQLGLYGQVSIWMREHGHGSVLEAWNDDFHRAMQLPAS